MRRIATAIFFLALAACAKDPGDLADTTHKNIDKLVADKIVCENETERGISCGINGRGALPQICNSGKWEDAGFCVDSDECLDEDARDLEKRCGLNGQGTQPQICVEGKWEDTGTCTDPDVCTNDDTQTIPCGLNGRGEKPQKCEDGGWADDGECVDPDECLDDDTRVIEKATCLDTIGDQPQKCVEGHWANDGLCRVLSPRFSPDAEAFYVESSAISLSTETIGAMIRYATDGSEPSLTNGDEYGGPITVSGTKTVKAKAFKNGMADSSTTSADYRVIRVPCTGQTKCYNTSGEMTCPTEANVFYGQDAQYAALGYCVPKSYTVSGNAPEEIVTDNNTGLQWQRTLSTDMYIWTDALTYCDNLSYGGHSDWRLPNVRELESIVDYGRANPTIDSAVFSDTPSSHFWTASPYANDANYVWRVLFSYGDVNTSVKPYNYNVRCVRGELLPSNNTFTETTVLDKVIVTDTATGLLWTKGHVASKTWQAALSYCENLDYAGHTDWRLPNIEELKTLVNREKYSTKSDFPEMPSAYFWSASSLISGADTAWHVYFGNGGVLNILKTATNHARCVR